MTAIPGLWTPPRIRTPLRRRWRPSLAWMMAHLGLDKATGHLMRASDGHLSQKCPTTGKPNFTCLDKVDVQNAPSIDRQVMNFSGGNDLAPNRYRVYVVEGAVKFGAPYNDGLWRANGGGGYRIVNGPDFLNSYPTGNVLQAAPGSDTGYATVDACTLAEGGACVAQSSSKACTSFDHPGGPIGIILDNGGNPDGSGNVTQGNPSLKFMLCRTGCDDCPPGGSTTPNSVTINFDGVDQSGWRCGFLRQQFPGVRIDHAYEGDLDGSYDMGQTATFLMGHSNPYPAVAPCGWGALSNTASVLYLTSEIDPPHQPLPGCPDNEGGRQWARIYLWRGGGRWWLCVFNYEVGPSITNRLGDALFAGVSEEVPCDTVVEIHNLITKYAIAPNLGHCGEFNFTTGRDGTATVIPFFA